MADDTDAKAANVILAQDKSVKPITVDGIVNAGMVTIHMPSETEQRAGWYDKHAWVLIQQYPGIYKTPQAKGQPKAKAEQTAQAPATTKAQAESADKGGSA